MVILERIRVFCDVYNELQLFTIDCQCGVIDTVPSVPVSFILGVRGTKLFHSHSYTLFRVRLQVSPAQKHHNSIDSHLVQFRS